VPVDPLSQKAYVKRDLQLRNARAWPGFAVEEATPWNMLFKRINSGRVGTRFKPVSWGAWAISSKKSHKGPLSPGARLR
jgi:hypothetical protein